MAPGAGRGAAGWPGRRAAGRAPGWAAARAPPARRAPGAAAPRRTSWTEDDPSRPGSATRDRVASSRRHVRVVPDRRREARRMGSAARLSGCAAALALVFAGAWAAGAETTTARPTAAPPAVTMTSDDADPAPGHPASSGLAGSAPGYTLTLQGVSTFVPGAPAELAFAVTGGGGRPG